MTFKTNADDILIKIIFGIILVAGISVVYVSFQNMVEQHADRRSIEQWIRKNCDHTSHTESQKIHTSDSWGWTDPIDCYKCRSVEQCF